PNDGPGKGLGEGGERLHYWVFGGPWTYEGGTSGEATGEGAVWLEETMSRIGAVVGGRWTYEAAERWGGENPGACRSSSSRTVPRPSPKAVASRSCRESGRRSSRPPRQPATRTST